MPRVPTYDNFQQMPAQFQPVQIQPATPRVDPGAQAASFGQAAQRAGAVAMDMELEALKQANQLRVDDALTRNSARRSRVSARAWATTTSARSSGRRSPSGAPSSVPAR